MSEWLMLVPGIAILAYAAIMLTVARDAGRKAHEAGRRHGERIGK